MRWFARLLVLALVGLAVWWFAPRMQQFDADLLLGRNREAWKLEMVPQADIAVTYVAERERWLSFPVAAGANRFRIVSNASLLDIAKARADRAADPRRRWRYALDIEVLDGNGGELLRRRHHFRTDIADLRLEDQRIVTTAFYLNEALSPASGVVVVLNLAGLPQAARLRIRAADMDQDIADIGVRTYFPESASERQIDYLWQRLSERQKSSLAKGSVYAHELLSEQERRNLLHNQWQPAGPQGADGGDFRKRELYVLRDVEGEQVDDPIAPAGIVAAPGRPAVFALPEQGGRVDFQAVPLAGDDAAPASASAGLARLTGRWYGVDSVQREDVSLALTPATAVPANPSALGAGRHFGGGLVELEASTPMALRAFMDIDGVRTEITPEKLYQRFFVAETAHPVSFAIAHEGGRATPVRLEARHLQNATAPARPPVLYYEFTGTDGSVLRHGEVTLDVRVARYDEALGAAPGAVVSDPLALYFAVPPMATGLRLTPAISRDGASQAPVLVSLATRPARLARQIRAPEDRFDFAARGVRVPAWFAVNPTGYPRLIAENRSQLIAMQSRPPRDQPERLSGQFIREDFRPRGRWLARHLLTPRETGMPLREEALPATFTPLTAGRAQRLDFPRWMGLRQVTPTLLWVASDDKPFSATIFVDGRPQHVFGGHGRYGETRLPPLSAGAHELRVDITADGSKWPRLFINHANASADAYVMRLAARIDSQLAFDIERTSTAEESVSARLFQPGGWRGRTRLGTRIEGPAPATLTPLTGWLFGDRQYDVRPDRSWSAPVFDTRGERSDAGQPVQILFPAGTPTGRYRIVFSIEQGPAGYLSLSRITPGVETRRRLFEETEVRHVVVE